MPPKKSKLSCIEGTFDSPIDGGASLYRATVTYDKVRARSTPGGLPTHLLEMKLGDYWWKSKFKCQSKVKDTDTSNIKELIVRKAIEN